ncbi:MAG TPA: sensor histidine kinase, partial [Gammaproteobacteria bacterium]|nr:sensor histidine kinase [Gammaproteobacteria bacterium]
RLVVDIDMPPALGSLGFPPLLLISLVETAVRHGVEPKTGSARIELAARRDERRGVPRLEVSVQDDGVGLAEGLVEGTGLANVSGQLEALYGAAARLSIESRATGGVRAAISIPIGLLAA